MASVTWPARLPNPTISGYGVQPGEAILRTEMEAGPARQRRRFRQVPSRVSVRWVFDDWQFALFEAWYRHSAKEGAEWFAIALYGGQGTEVQQARFTRQFQAGLVTAKAWEVTTELEIRERPTLSADALAVALSENIEGLSGGVDGLHDFVHGTLPGPDGWNTKEVKNGNI